MGIGTAKLSWTVLNSDKIPQAEYPRWAVVGRSNVGKSSFLNALVHPQKLFKTGARAGVTIGLIAVSVQITKRPEPVLELVDLPGWGFVKRTSDQAKEWGRLAEVLRKKSPMGLQWLLLVDPLRKPLEEEWMFLEWLNGAPFLLLFTKSDKVKSNARAEIERAWSEFVAAASEKAYWVSANNGENIQEIIKSSREFVRLHSKL